ncbi:MAG: hypothetical protein QMD00_00520 [Hadesarchaea archaeon]|nr:hypothetical protein [Hadesarchaea archaeon]
MRSQRPGSRQGPKKAEPKVEHEIPKPKEPPTVEAPSKGRNRLIVGTIVGVIAMLIFAVLLVALVRPTGKGVTAAELFAQYDDATRDFSSYYKDGDAVLVTDVIESATLISPTLWENFSYYSSLGMSFPTGYSILLRLRSLENTLYSYSRVVVEGDLTGEVGKKVTITLHMKGFNLGSYGSYYENRTYVFPMEIILGSIAYMYDYVSSTTVTAGEISGTIYDNNPDPAVLDYSRGKVI